MEHWSDMSSSMASLGAIVIIQPADRNKLGLNTQTYALIKPLSHGLKHIGCADVDTNMPDGCAAVCT